MHERYRRQTDGRATAYSEREREFTFANKMYSAAAAAVVQSRHVFNLDVFSSHYITNNTKSASSRSTQKEQVDILLLFIFFRFNMLASAPIAKYRIEIGIAS